MLTARDFAERRKQVFARMEADSIAILPGSNEILRNGDAEYPFRQNSNFYYLTGYNEPEAVAILLKQKKSQQYILFNRARNFEIEQWTGERVGQDGALKDYGADQAFPIEDLDNYLPTLLENCQVIYYALDRNHAFDHRVLKALRKVRGKLRNGVGTPENIHNIELIIHEMRLIKSPEEIEIMRKAAQISAKAHMHAITACKPGMHEYQLEAELIYQFMQQGATQVAYSSIVAGGANACVLHYVKNSEKLNDGDLVLIDAGCEYQNYASDITRTFPVNGKFSPEQKAIYDLVLTAQTTAIEMIKPGVEWPALQKQIVTILTEGLVGLKILSGHVPDLIEQQAYRPFYMHNSGHWLGLDVHDAGAYKEHDQWRKLQANMVLTVEPGLYIPARSDVPEKWHNIGVRIEDDVAVTQTGFEVLSKDCVKTIDAITALMTGG